MWRAVLHQDPLHPLAWAAALALAGWTVHRELGGQRPARGGLALVLACGVGFWAVAAGRPGALEALLAGLALALPLLLLSLAARASVSDALTLGAVGAWVGLHGGALVLLATSLAGSLYALGYAAHRRRLAVALAETSGVARVVVWSVLGEDRTPGPGPLGTHPLPYAPAILAGVVLAGAGTLMGWGR